ncbi:MAG TPA: ATP-binding protein [Caulobacteraceae bacterium]|jgi:predicted kinase|nr:ATP-binding protein [Caulobacteraceae bacterium]
MAEPLVHLVCGSTGAGKTTYALRLTAQLGGVRFSIDEWMTALFWRDSPQPIEAAWALERIERCQGLIWSTAAQVAGRGLPVVLDLGFTKAAARARFAGLAREAGLAPKLHFVDVPAEERWRRVEARNADKGPARQLGFAVTRGMFDFVEGMWEPPTPAEMDACEGVRVPGRRPASSR